MVWFQLDAEWSLNASDFKIHLLLTKMKPIPDYYTFKSEFVFFIPNINQNQFLKLISS